MDRSVRWSVELVHYRCQWTGDQFFRVALRGVKFLKKMPEEFKQ